MGNLGDAVSALLDTYTECLSLLKRLHHHRPRPSDQQQQQQSSPPPPLSSIDADPSGLAAALRKARARVLRSYSSGVARRGPAFEKGDGKSSTTTTTAATTACMRPLSCSCSARAMHADTPLDYVICAARKLGVPRRGRGSELWLMGTATATASSRKSLSRVVGRLTTTMAGLGTWFTRGEATALQSDGAMTYSSLVSLCNSSHTDAVRAMTDLSSRISSHAGSRTSVRSSVVAASVSTKPKSTSKSNSKSKPKLKSKSKSSKRSEGHRSSSARSRHRHAPKDKLEATDQSSTPKTKTRTGAKSRKEHGDKPEGRDRSGSTHSTRTKRLSRLTMSSASTKLGEVRGHGRGRGRPDQQSVAAYPRHSLEFGGDGSLGAREGKEKRRWWHF